MKKLITIISILAFSTIAHAGEYYKPKKIVKNYSTTNITNVSVDSYENEFGLELDSPYLVRLSENWYIGTRMGKDLYETNADQGWFGYGKVTYTGTLFSFKK